MRMMIAAHSLFWGDVAEHVILLLVASSHVPLDALCADALQDFRVFPHPVRDWECFDADTGKDSAREIREYFIPDFSDWKDHDKYKSEFERLMGNLRAEEKKPAARG